MDVLVITVPYAIRLSKPTVMIIQMDGITFDFYPIPYDTKKRTPSDNFCLQ